MHFIIITVRFYGNISHDKLAVIKLLIKKPQLDPIELTNYRPTSFYV